MEVCGSMSIQILFVVTLFLVWIKGSLSVECFKNEDLGYRKPNVYQCDDPEKPNCCEEEQEFTCCVDPVSSTLKNQFGLWGAISAIVVVIILVFICCKKDIQFCSGETPLIDRCRRKKAFGEEKDGDQSKFIPSKPSNQLPSSPSTSCSTSSNDTTSGISRESTQEGNNRGFAGSRANDGREQGYTNRGYEPEGSSSGRSGSRVSRVNDKSQYSSARY